ncbi:hypothetical protein Lesp01_55460 [Lentzea sp. NBRC 102530]|nr:hypothetical protein Lesp01_55460 [Lentzea sp. NBRC 102530]
MRAKVPSAIQGMKTGRRQAADIPNVMQQRGRHEQVSIVNREKRRRQSGTPGNTLDMLPSPRKLVLE